MSLVKTAHRLSLELLVIRQGHYGKVVKKLSFRDHRFAGVCQFARNFHYQAMLSPVIRFNELRVFRNESSHTIYQRKLE